MTTAPVKAEGQWMEWSDVWKALFGATAVALIGSLVAYFRSIGGKADKAAVEKLLKDQRDEFDKYLAQMRVEYDRQFDIINRRHSAWEQKTERFATREMLMEMKQDFQRLESRFETNFQKINDLLVKIAEK